MSAFSNDPFGGRSGWSQRESSFATPDNSPRTPNAESNNRQGFMRGGVPETPLVKPPVAPPPKPFDPLEFINPFIKQATNAGMDRNRQRIMAALGKQKTLGTFGMQFGTDLANRRVEGNRGRFDTLANGYATSMTRLHPKEAGLRAAAGDFVRNFDRNTQNTNIVDPNDVIRRALESQGVMRN